VANGVLASCSDESAVRLWDFDNSENYVLGTQGNEIITCISFNKDKGIYNTI